MKTMKNSRLHAIVAVLATLQMVALAEDIECFADGECTQSLIVNEWPVVDAQECLETCRGYDGCEFFTYYGNSDDYCMGFANCVELDDKNCDECYSGNKTCPDLQCWVPGICEGSSISSDVVSREQECLDACKSTVGCDWFTFDESDGVCILLENCLNMGDCDTCWSSQVQCGERRDFTKVLLIGGSDENFIIIDDVEVVVLSSEAANCDSVSNYPFPVSFLVGTILEGIPTACGGYNADLGMNTNECYQYLFEENRWVLMEQSMLEARASHKASMVDPATWLITGGRDNDGVTLYSSEVWKDGAFQPGPNLPIPLYNHCQVTLNSSYVAIVGGGTGPDGAVFPHNFFLLDWENNDWISMPEIPVGTAADSCGLIENSVNGFELVVLADYNNCYIFNFEDMTWREGPNIPYGIFLTWSETTVQMEKTFYIMGGLYTDLETVTDAIFQFDNENYVWLLESTRLKAPRIDGLAIAVPDEMVNCN